MGEPNHSDLGTTTQFHNGTQKQKRGWLGRTWRWPNCASVNSLCLLHRVGFQQPKESSCLPVPTVLVLTNLQCVVVFQPPLCHGWQTTLAWCFPTSPSLVLANLTLVRVGQIQSSLLFKQTFDIVGQPNLCSCWGNKPLFVWATAFRSCRPTKYLVWVRQPNICSCPQSKPFFQFDQQNICFWMFTEPFLIPPTQRFSCCRNNILLETKHGVGQTEHPVGQPNQRSCPPTKLVFGMANQTHVRAGKPHLCSQCQKYL